MNINAVSHTFSSRVSGLARAIRKRLLRSHRVPCQHFRLFVIVCIVLAGMKLWLVHGREIVARTEATADDISYLNAAAHWYWETPYGVYAYVRLPAYPLWIALNHAVGLPFRIGTEILQIVAAFAWASALLKVGVWYSIATIIYAATIFQPVGFFVNDCAQPDSFYAAMLWFLMAGFACLFAEARSRDAIFTGLAMAILWQTREESFLLLAALAVFCAIQAFRIYVTRNPQRSFGNALLRPLVIILTVTFSVSITCKTLNYFSFGLFAKSDFSAPGFRHALKALTAIAPPHPTPRFLIVSNEALELAGQVSQTFRELLPDFLGKRGQGWATFGRAQTHLREGIAPGWFPWALRDIAAAAGHHRTAVEANAFYQRIADELDAAFKAERLRKRYILSAYIDPDFGRNLPFISQALQAEISLFAIDGLLPRFKDSRNTSTLPTRALFNRMLMRRADLIQAPTGALTGWVFSTSDPIGEVGIVSTQSNNGGFTRQLLPRPDVRKVFGFMGQLPIETGFELVLPIDAAGKVAGDLVFRAVDGMQFVVPKRDIRAGPPRPLSADERDHPGYYCLESMQIPDVARDESIPVESMIARLHPSFLRWLTWLAVGAFVLIVLRFRAVSMSGLIYATLFLTGFVILERVCLLTLLSASVWPGTEHRYLFPVMPLYTSFLLILIQQGISAAKQRAVSLSPAAANRAERVLSS
jgi:hypothetical protein